MTSEYYKSGYSDDERETRSERARQMHQEMVVDEQTGLPRRKFGGAQPRSGRPRALRASEIIAEKVHKEADIYYERLNGIAKEGSDTNSIIAIKELLGIEEKERQVAAEEEQNLDKLQRDEILLLALDLLKETGILGRGLSRVGEVEVIRDGEVTELNP